MGAYVVPSEMDSLANIVSKLEMLLGGEKGRCFADNQTPGYNMGVAVERLNGIYNHCVENIKKQTRHEQGIGFDRDCVICSYLEKVAAKTEELENKVKEEKRP